VTGGPNKKYILALWGCLFGFLIFLGLQDGGEVIDNIQYQYDDVDELNQIIKQSFEDRLAEINHDAPLRQSAALNPAIDVPPPSAPGAVIAKVGEAGITDKKEGPNEEESKNLIQEGVNPPAGYVRGEIDPAKGVLLKLVEVADDEKPEVDISNIKYDDAEWHYDGDFPEDAPMDNAYAHIGFFYVWAVEEGLEGDFARQHFKWALIATKLRLTSPIKLVKHNDDKLTSDLLNDEGNAFAIVYYKDNENGYLPDFIAEFSDHDVYRVKPTWKNYDRIKPVIDRRYAEWKAGR